jgi:hypothetical protein
MPARLPNLAWALRAALIAVLLPLLADCGPKRNEFAPVCPRPALLAEAADMDRYRPSANPGGGHDLTDLILHGRVAGVTGQCQPGNSRTQLAVALTVSLEMTRGPAMAGREADVQYFVAVTEGETILDKRVFATRVAFPANVDRVTWTSDVASLVLPINSTKSGAAYSILVGFQLTPDELVANQQRQSQ